MSIIPVRSVQEAMRSAERWGPWAPSFQIRDTAAITASTTASGSMTTRRVGARLTVPTMGDGCVGAFCTAMRASAGSQGLVIAGAEFELGSLAVATNTFTSGVSMPERRNGTGRQVQWAARDVFVAVTSALTATTPTITITYTNQDGVGSRTATITLPTSPALNTAFPIRPDQLQSGDTGIRSVENMSKSAGTAGTLKVFGLLPLGVEPLQGSSQGGQNSNVQIPSEAAELVSGDSIGFYYGAVSSTNVLVGHLCLLGAS